MAKPKIQGPHLQQNSMKRNPMAQNTKNTSRYDEKEAKRM
jgi:hypothetical protein